MSNKINKAIELGFRAPMDAVLKAGRNAEKNKVDSFYVCETFPETDGDKQSFGVNAFDAIRKLAAVTEKIKLGTGIVSCFSRSLEDMQNLSKDMYSDSDERFSLGIGTGPEWAARKWGVSDFEKPLSRMVDYVSEVKMNSSIKVYSAANGPKMIETLSTISDGMRFFMKPKNVLKDDIHNIKSYLSDMKKDYEKFDVGSIVPVYFTHGLNNTESERSAIESAKLTIANYIIGNKFYHKDLNNSGYDSVVKNVLKKSKLGLMEAADSVTRELVDELTIYGSPSKCVDKLNSYVKDTGIDTIVAGFDSKKESYDEKFFKKLDEFSYYYSRM